MKDWGTVIHTAVTGGSQIVVGIGVLLLGVKPMWLYVLLIGVFWDVFFFLRELRQARKRQKDEGRPTDLRSVWGRTKHIEYWVAWAVSGVLIIIAITATP